MGSAREDIFDRIRKANAGVNQADRESEYGQIERSYRQQATTGRAEILDCFIDRLHDYGCGVYRCSEEEIAATIADVLHDSKITMMLISAGVPAKWLPDGVDFKADQGLTYEALNQEQGVLTKCATAIALTGTIILSHAEERRALTLIPDYHLCVVFEEQVKETVPEAIRQFNGFANAPLTTIAGPSATADIEMTRIKGVHGPRSLDVILVNQADPGSIG